MPQIEENISRLYKISGIGVATYIGGFLATGYLLFRNYQALGETTKAKLIAALTIPAVIFGFYIESLVPLDFVSRQIVLLPQVAITVIALYIFHGNAIRAHQEAGFRLRSNWVAIAVGIIACLIYAAFFYAHAKVIGNA